MQPKSLILDVFVDANKGTVSRVKDAQWTADGALDHYTPGDRLLFI